MPPSPAPHTPFVGRAAELDLLLALSREAREGEGSVVLLSGEAGIGKSRLVRELASRIEAEGGQTATGVAHEDSAEAFAAAADLLRAASRRAAGEARDVLRAAEASLMSAPQEATEAPSAAGRRHLFDSVAEALGVAARASPPLVLAVLEDIHWADHSSLRLATSLARRIAEHPAVLVCTFRPEQATNPALLTFVDTVRQEHLGTRLTLHSLGDEEATEIVRSVTRSELAADDLDQIIQRADGNPLFIEELARAGRRSVAAAGGQGVPEGIRNLVQRRLMRFAAPVRQVAAAAAVLGDAVRLASVCELWGGSFDEAGEAIDELIGARIIEPDDGTTVRFRHALIREAIYAALPLAERHRLHLAAAGLLERDFGTSAAVLIASHLQSAGTDDEARRAIDWWLVAAEHALKVMAFEDVLAQLTEAEAVIGRTGAMEQQSIKAALLGGEAARQMGLLDESLKLFRVAADLGTQTADSTSEARAALGYELAFAATGRPRSEPGSHSLALLDRALSHLVEQPETAGLRARLLAASAQARFFTGEAREAARLSAAALDTARASGDKGAEAAALEARRIATWRPENLQERTALTREIVALGEVAGDCELILDGLYWLSGCLLESGATAEARAAVKRFASLADESHQPRRASEATRMLGMMALLDGDLALAKSLAERSLSDAERAGSVDARVHYAAQMLEILRDSDELVPFVRSITSEPGQWLASPTRRAMLSSLLARTGEVREAGRLIEGLASERFEELPRDWMWFPLMFLLSEAIAIVANPGWAEMVHALLAPFGERLVVNSNTACYGSVEFALGTLALTAGWSSAANHFAAAAERNEAAGAPLWAERARRELGRCQPDSSATRQQHDQAQLPGGLTPREAEVLRLIAAGHSNQEIADRLVLSVRTVERHITNLYGKIDARGKADATAFALRHGLVS